VDPLRVLYVVYWGAMEPLGQSLVLPAVEQLSQRGVRLHLATYEKASGRTQEPLAIQVRTRLKAAGIAWKPLDYHKRPRIPATGFDVLRGWIWGVRAGRRAHVQLVHGRTFIGGLIGRAVASTLRVPFIYHNEGFYPDEMVDGSFWRAGSPQHRLAKRLEAMMYDSAAGLIVLSQRAADEVASRPAVRRHRTPVITVPSCVDLAHFQPHSGSRPSPDPMRLVYSGAVGGRYELNRVGRFVSILGRRRAVHLTVLSREHPGTIATMLAAGGLDPRRWSHRFVPHPEMPDALRKHHAGLFFLARGASEHGCSPTKVGEYWACGMPVVTSPNVSDIDEIVRKFRVGIVVPDESDATYVKAGEDLEALLTDPELPGRCRQAAEQHYALGPACDRQASLYSQLARP
jgi:glycosyltransferase involved in cell wall biosynthesis